MADDLNGEYCKASQMYGRFLGSGQLRMISKLVISLG